MPTVCERRGGLIFCGLLAGLRLLTGESVPSANAAEYEACKFFSQLPDDCAAAEHRKFDGLRGYRYEEIDLFARDPLKKVLYVSTYNTTGENAGEDTRDFAPEIARAKRRPETGGETIPGAFGLDQSATLLDAGLAIGPGRRREEFRRSRRGVDGKQPRAQSGVRQVWLPSVSTDAGGEISRRGLQERIAGLSAR